VRSEADAEAWDMAFEVRDKPVAVSDVQIFGKKCVDMQVLEIRCFFGAPCRHLWEPAKPSSLSINVLLPLKRLLYRWRFGVGLLPHKS
jgi:hypothetical protein